MSEQPDREMLPVPAEPEEVVQAVADAPAPDRLRGAASSLPVQAAAAAAGGFMAGAAVIGLVGRRKRSRAVRGRRGRRGSTRLAAEGLNIVASRSLLLDVHLLGGSAADR